jgi:hypothetical protein
MDDFKDTTAHNEIESGDDLHEYKTNEGYIIDAGDTAYSDLKVARDGKFIRHAAQRHHFIIYSNRQIQINVADDMRMNRTHHSYTPTLR